MELVPLSSAWPPLFTKVTRTEAFLSLRNLVGITMQLKILWREGLLLQTLQSPTVVVPAGSSTWKPLERWEGLLCVLCALGIF